MNKEIIKSENLAFLQETLKYLGLDDKLYLNQQMVEKMAEGPERFQLETGVYFDVKNKLDLNLYFRRSRNTDIYFLDKYDATYSSLDDADLNRSQTFYISKGTGMTVREAYNLLQGRAVNKDLESLEGEKYNAWLQLNFSEKDQNNNYRVKPYRTPYGYDLEKTLDRYPILELTEPDLRANLIKSLRQGDQVLVSFEKATRTEKMAIEANPQFKTINIYASLKNGIRRDSTRQENSAPKTDQQAGANDNSPDADSLSTRRVKRGR